jgi:signal transduction histidine kinase
MKFWQILDFASLRIRLTIGIAAVSALGLGSVAIWTSMQMQQILVATHKENIKYITERVPHDIEIYSDMVSLTEGTQKAIDNLSTENRLLWLKNSNSQVIAQSEPLKTEAIGTILLKLNRVPPIPQVQDLNGHYWLICATPLQVKDRNLGKLYIAQDITKDQTMFINLIRSLSIASLLAIAIMTIAIAYYINYLIKPLKTISQLTETISLDKLQSAQIYLENAPSEVKELAVTFDRMLVRLSEAWEHQRQLLSNVSHELRTPLTIISGYIQSTLRRGNNLTEIQKEALMTAASEAERTVQLLQDLLDLARADSGRMHFQFELILLNELVQEVIGMAKQYSDRHIKIKSSSPAIKIKADANRLKQILLNLIDNAIKYSEQNRPIILKIYQQNNQAIIEVCDRGIGIPLQQQGRIFERFYRIDEARNRSSGTGLGLSIVKTLVEGMGGNITVRSQLGEGSTFIISFGAID